LGLLGIETGLQIGQSWPFVDGKKVNPACGVSPGLRGDDFERRRGE
jgi:hypothetical protein